MSFRPTCMGRTRVLKRRRAVLLLLIMLLALAFLSVLVKLGATSSLDEHAREFMRPNGVWGQVQIKADWVVEGLRPRNAVAIAAILAVISSGWRRSLQPLAFVFAVFGTGGLGALALKFALRRRDVGGGIGGLGGSFPSGHVVCVMLLLGCGVMLLSRRPARLLWTVVPLGGALMGCCLLVQSAHWLTDVVGAMLLSGAVLAAANVSWEREGTGATLSDSYCGGGPDAS